MVLRMAASVNCSLLPCVFLLLLFISVFTFIRGELFSKKKPNKQKSSAGLFFHLVFMEARILQRFFLEG